MTDLQKAKLHAIQEMQLKIKELLMDDALDGIESPAMDNLVRFERKARIALVELQDS